MNARPVIHAISLTLLSALFAAACGLGRSGNGAARGTDRVPVVVENQNFYEATIYALVSSSRTRLGDVRGNSTTTLSAPQPIGAQLRIEVRLLAVGAYTSYPVDVAPGDTVRVVVPPNLHVYPGRPR